MNPKQPTATEKTSSEAPTVATEGTDSPIEPESIWGPRALATITEIRKGIKEGQTACIPELARIVNTLSMNIRDIPVHHLTATIEGDPIILQRVIDASNKIGYNPLNIPISSLSSAIQMIGFDRVRSLAMTMILLENAHKDQYSSERQDASLLALASGLMTRRLAINSKYHVDHDVAFICGALRGYGQILLATYMPRQTKEAEARANHLFREEVYREIFGLTPLQLTREILEDSDLPEIVTKSLVKYKTNVKAKKPVRLSRKETLSGLAEFGFSSMELALDPRIDAEQYKDTLDRIAGRYSRVIDHDGVFFTSQVVHTRDYINKLRRDTAARTFPQVGLDCLDARIEDENPPTPKKPKEPAIEPESEAPRDGSDYQNQEPEKSYGLEDSDEFWTESIATFAKVDSKAGLTGTALDQLFKILDRAFDSDEIWLFLPGKERQSFRIAHSMGTHELVLGNRATLAKKEPSIFGLCLRRNDIMVIRNSRQPQIRKHLPKWYQENVELDAFVLCSVFHQDKTIGLIYIGWKNPRNFEVQPEKAPLLRKIIDKAAAIASM